MLCMYRRLLRLYPANYRREFADEMLVVFEDARSDAACRGVTVRAIFNVREASGLVSGALGEHLRLLGARGFRLSVRREGFIMRNGFRFPKSTAVLMTLILGGVLMAIKRGGEIEASLPHVNPPIAPIQPAHGALVPPVVLLWMFFCALGVVGWGILFALRRSGMHRLAEMSGDRK